jgi:hypothetical protein
MKYNWKIRGFLLQALFWFAAFTSFSQTEATTADGKKILVYPDRTWKPAPIGSLSGKSPTPILNLELPSANPQDQIIHHTQYLITKHIMLRTG